MKHTARDLFALLLAAGCSSIAGAASSGPPEPTVRDHVTCFEDDGVAVVDPLEAKLVTRVRIPVGRGPHVAPRSPDGSSLYVTCEGDMKGALVDAKSWKVRGEISLMAFPRVLVPTPDGKKLYQTIRLLNGALKEVVDRIAFGRTVFAPQGKDAHGLAVTPDGRELWISTQSTSSVAAIDTATHGVVGRIEVGKDPNWVGFSPDGSRAVISNTGSGDITIVDVAWRNIVVTVEVGRSPKRLAVGAVAQ
jgi:YVTN family beta-propeller protein